MFLGKSITNVVSIHSQTYGVCGLKFLIIIFRRVNVKYYAIIMRFLPYVFVIDIES